MEEHDLLPLVEIIVMVDEVVSVVMWKGHAVESDVNWMVDVGESDAMMMVDEVEIVGSYRIPHVVGRSVYSE